LISLKNEQNRKKKKKKTFWKNEKAKGSQKCLLQPNQKLCEGVQFAEILPLLGFVCFLLFSRSYLIYQLNSLTLFPAM